MPSITWPLAGRARRTLIRGITGFTATLPSSHPGISFTARIRGRISWTTNCVPNQVLLATAIRLALREAARDVTCRASPADLAEATDMCNQRLAMPLPIPLHPDVQVTGRVALSLSGDNRKALAEFVAASRKQGILDLSQRQRASAIREHFTDPAFALAWWMDQGEDSARKLPKAEELRAMADTLEKYPRIAGHPIEYQVLDLLRAFIAEFPEQHQKQALLTLLSNGFQRAGANKLAKRAESLASDTIPGNGNPSTL